MTQYIRKCLRNARVPLLLVVVAAVLPLPFLNDECRTWLLKHGQAIGNLGFFAVALLGLILATWRFGFAGRQASAAESPAEAAQEQAEAAKLQANVAHGQTETAEKQAGSAMRQAEAATKVAEAAANQAVAVKQLGEVELDAEEVVADKAFVERPRRIRRLIYFTGSTTSGSSTPQTWSPSSGISQLCSLFFARSRPQHMNRTLQIERENQYV